MNKQTIEDLLDLRCRLEAEREALHREGLAELDSIDTKIRAVEMTLKLYEERKATSSATD